MTEKSAEEPAVADLIQRLLRRAQMRAVLPLVAAAVLLLGAFLWLGHEIGQHLHAIESWITHLGPWGVIAFIAFFVLGTCFLLPDTVLCLAAGALFGLEWGVAAVVVGSLLAGALQYALSRRLLRAWILRKLARQPLLAAIQRAVIHEELRLQLLLRLTPLNPATINYLLGAVGVRFPGFLTACLALIPNLVIEVYFGHAGKHVAGMAGARAAQLHDLAILGGVAAGLVVMVLVSRMARKAVLQAIAASESADSGAHLGL